VLDGLAVDDLLTPAMREMGQKFPRTELVLFTFGYEELATRLYDGRLDVIFSRKFDVEPRNEIEYREIEHAEDYLIARAGYPLSTRGRRLTANDLRYDTLSIVTESEDDMAIRTVKTWFNVCDVMPRFRNTPSYHASLQWVKAGLSVTIGDRRSILPTTGLVKMPLEQFRDPSLVLAWHAGNSNEARKPFEKMVAEAQENPRKEFTQYAASSDL
jgi:DNA-binding transcriptional LysR family regulator